MGDFLPKGFNTLRIDVQRPDWRNEINIHRTDKYLKALEKARNNAEHAICHFCGFPDSRFLELHHVNGDHDDFTKENLKYACSLCHRLHHLGWIGIKSNGKLFPLPSIPSAKPKPHSLEIFNIIQRFFIMSQYMTEDEQRRFKGSGLYESMESLIGGFKQVNLQDAYLEKKRQIAEMLKNQRDFAVMSAEEKKNALQKKNQAAYQQSNKEEDVEVYNIEYLNIIDLVDGLCEQHKLHLNQKLSPPTPADVFFNQQATGEFGRLTILYNETIFEPFEPNPTYTLQDRLDYYHSLNMFSKEGIGSIMQKAKGGQTTIN